MTADQNAKKSGQLGMPFGTANNKLRKMLLFKLARELNYDVCYRCSLPIEEIGNFTIEHKSAWLDVDPELFWDLDNIAFSHMACNIGAARRHKVTLCFKCKKNPARRDKQGRAKECRECNAELKREWRARTNRN